MSLNEFALLQSLPLSSCFSIHSVDIIPLPVIFLMEKPFDSNRHLLRCCKKLLKSSLMNPCIEQQNLNLFLIKSCYSTYRWGPTNAVEIMIYDLFDMRFKGFLASVGICVSTFENMLKNAFGFVVCVILSQ